MTKATVSDVEARGAEILKQGREVIEREASGLDALADHLDQSFVETVVLLDEALNRGGRVLLTGIGKSGLVARKIASTLCSTGAPATFVHPTEAAHGDLGLLTAADVLIAISRSGDTEALEPVLAMADRLGIPLVAITSVMDSRLAEAARLTVSIDVGPEADPDRLVPSVSSTATMALGDALAISLFRTRGLRASDFASLHPGGALGRRLSWVVRDLMRSGEDLPIVRQSDGLLEVLHVISNKRLGLAVVVDGNDAMVGVLTDGDVRRALIHDPEALDHPVGEFMTKAPRVIEPQERIVRAIQRMEEAPQVTALVVLEGRRPVGVVHLHDCLQAGVR